MAAIPPLLQHFTWTRAASLHRGNAALYGVITSEPRIKPIAYDEFAASAGNELEGAVTAFAAERGFVFSHKDSIGFEVLYTDMGNNPATFFFLTTTGGQTLFVNFHGDIELVE